MPKALNPKATFDFVLEEDRDLPDGHPYKTVFHLRPLTLDEEEKLANTMLGGKMGSDELTVQSGSYQRSILNFGLTGWSNFNDVETEGEADDYADWSTTPVAFERERGNPRPIKSGCLDRLSGKARAELANAVTTAGQVSADEGNG